VTASPKTRARALAFYLPQYHPIPENDLWWGKGFTEWTNVVRATPRFPGHYQPHLPADLGFYDLRLPEVREAQAALARQSGIHGFCYFHYWFNEKILLGRPLADVLASGKPDFPFCVCWANENWTRRWDGKESEVLAKQHYSLEDDALHLRWLARVFRDPRYVRIDGKPVFLVYKVNELPDPLATTNVWREEAKRLGLGELYLCRVESAGQSGDPAPLGFDAAVEFCPHNLTRLIRPLRRQRPWKLLRKLRASPAAYGDSQIREYADAVDAALGLPEAPYKQYRCVVPSWDNAARRKTGAVIFKGATPELYERWLGATLERFRPYSAEENLVFINAWNEWAEGNHLEPDQRHGHAYLTATRRALAAAAPGVADQSETSPLGGRPAIEKPAISEGEAAADPS
jgi:lipopolysaccharide biosynthesis protein